MIRREPALKLLAACLRAGPHLVDGPMPRIRDSEWLEILAAANHHLLTPTLARAIAVHPDSAPTEVRRYASSLHLMNRKRNVAIRRQALELVQAFNRVGVTPMLLKGVLILTVDRQLGASTRMMADIDIAVTASAAARAVAVLHECGYAVRNAYPSGHHAVAEFARPGDPAAVDLHLELIDQRYVLSAGEVWTDARCFRARENAMFLYPAPTHRLLHNILHAQIHYLGGFYRGALDLRQLYEFACLMRFYDGMIDWDFIERRLRLYRLSTVLQSFLLNAGELFGAPWPLTTQATGRARYHATRCRIQHSHPWMRCLGVPWGNLRAALAWHRMAALHGSVGGGGLRWRWRHLRKVLTSHPPSFVIDKLFRA